MKIGPWHISSLDFLKVVIITGACNFLLMVPFCILAVFAEEFYRIPWQIGYIFLNLLIFLFWLLIKTRRA